MTLGSGGFACQKEIEKWAPATEADLPAQVQGLIAYRQADTAGVQASILADLSVRWDLLADAGNDQLCLLLVDVAETPNSLPSQAMASSNSVCGATV